MDMNITITGFYGRCYSSKSSAMRAMRNAAGSKMLVTHPMFSHFDAYVPLRAEMLAPTKLQGGWSFCWTYAPADVLVAVLGTDGMAHNVPFPEVAHWPTDWAMTHKYEVKPELCVTPRGTFPFGFEFREDALAAGYSLWFSHNGIEIYGNGDSARAIREPLEVRRNRLLAA
jgi:hypothetical protein